MVLLPSMRPGRSGIKSLDNLCKPIHEKAAAHLRILWIIPAVYLGGKGNIWISQEIRGG